MPSSDEADNSAGDRVDTPNPNDVLCGRSPSINSHRGNKQYRSIVEKRKRVYLTLRFKLEKRLIASSIVNEIRAMDPPGRFLARKGSIKDNVNGYCWYDIGYEKARDKTSQALRENAPSIRAKIGMKTKTNRQRAETRREETTTTTVDQKAQAGSAGTSTSSSSLYPPPTLGQAHHHPGAAGPMHPAGPHGHGHPPPPPHPHHSYNPAHQISRYTQQYYDYYYHYYGYGAPPPPPPPGYSSSSSNPPGPVEAPPPAAQPPKHPPPAPHTYWAVAPYTAATSAAAAPVAAAASPHPAHLPATAAATASPLSSDARPNEKNGNMSANANTTAMSSDAGKIAAMAGDPGAATITTTTDIEV